ncbi:MAG: VOC family protein [Betaproteobacteria bacterium]|jgi:catechol-2,3-dioxygenase|nr:VOC family protein [Betaproteobacteria bacterium]
MSARGPHVSFSHVGIHVHDLAGMEDFYTRLLGLVVTDRGPLETPLGMLDFVFLSRDPREHHQLVLASGRPAETPFNVLNQISFRLDSLADLRAMHERLKDFPASEVIPINHGNALSVYFRDPEGNRVELFIDTPWYVTQPLRIRFDFSESDESLMRWAEETARSLPGFRPVREWRREVAARMGLE